MKVARCPICDKVIAGEPARDLPTAPFCSARCRTIDLGRWLGEKYGIPQSHPGVDQDASSDGEDGD